MRMTAVFLGVLLAFISTGVAGATMVAGPLFPAFPDVVECELANISAYNRTIRIQILDIDGTIVADSGSIVLRPGHSTYLASTTAGLLHCKFIGATPTYFRGSIATYTPPGGSDFVALPAQ
jgi:hypothetical protein